MKIIGHRGARGLAPENTIAALHKGLEHRVDELEFDIRVTKDGRPVLHHDKYLHTPKGKKMLIAKHTYAELHKHKHDLATFTSMLHVIGHPVPLYVEVKPGEPVRSTVNVIRHHLTNGWKPEHFILASKSQKTLMQLHKALPAVPTLVIEPWSSWRARRRAKQAGTKRIAMNQLFLWKFYIKAVSRSGWELYAYTLNNPKKARRWAKAGLAGVITDYPDLFDKR
jgi:glycerophosphoryl diester phosphodiesterase